MALLVLAERKHRMSNWECSTVCVSRKTRLWRWMKNPQSVDSQQEEGNCCAALTLLWTQTTEIPPGSSGSWNGGFPLFSQVQQLQRAAEGSSGTLDTTDHAMPLPKPLFPSFFPFLFARLGSICPHCPAFLPATLFKCLWGCFHLKAPHFGQR